MIKIYSQVLTAGLVVLTAAPCLGHDTYATTISGSHPHFSMAARKSADSAPDAHKLSPERRTMRVSSADSPRRTIAGAGEMITEAPAGEVHASQVRSSWSFDVEFGQAYTDYVESMVGEFVVGDDGYIYIKNPFAFLKTDTYMKARLEGERATLTLPQHIYRDDIYGDGTEHDLYVARVKFVDDKDRGWYYMDEASQEITFDYKDGVLMQQDEQGVMYGVVTEDGDWLGFGDWNLVMKPSEDHIVTIPDGIEAKQYTLSHSLGSRLINVGFDGDKVYVSGLNPDSPQACMVGNKEGDMVTFPAAQYLGEYHYVIDPYTQEYLAYHTYFMPAKIVEEWNDVMEDYMEVYSVIENATFRIDSKTGVMSTDDVLLLNASKTITYYMDAFEDVRLLPYAGKKPAVPATPQVIEQMEIKDWFDDGDVYGAISFLLFNVDVDGNYINPDDLYYNIIVNDEVFTFTPEEYDDIEDDMTDIPYNFMTENNSIIVNGLIHNIYFFNPEYTKIGVRAKYTVDGVTNYSGTAYYGESGVKETDMEKEAVTVVYTDLLGNRVANPSAGLYIRTSTYADGSHKSVKTIIK